MKPAVVLVIYICAELWFELLFDGRGMRAHVDFLNHDETIKSTMIIDCPEDEFTKTLVGLYL